MRLWLVALVSGVLLGCNGLHAAAEAPSVRPGSVGVLYVHSQTADSTDIEIALPADSVVQYPTSLRETVDYKAASPVEYQGSITIFDQEGVIARLALSDPMVLKFWCENDGGMQFRPTLQATIENSVLARPLRPQTEIQEIAAFVAIDGPSSTIPPITRDTSDLAIRLKGTRNSNGNPDALIHVSQDDAGNCAGKPDNNLTINLETAHGQPRAMRCCGP